MNWRSALLTILLALPVAPAFAAGPTPAHQKMGAMPITPVPVTPAPEAAPKAAAEDKSFNGWLKEFKKRAFLKGIQNKTMIVAFNGVRPSERVIELDGKQPEKKIGFDEYRKRTITSDRVSKGQALLKQNWKLLSAVEKEYGVQAQYIVALWGIETSYGKNTGGFDLIQALATLAWEGRRGEYFEAELIRALKILQGNHVQRKDFKGSWAGAMGQIQFMPSSWFTYAVDYNGDGHKDIWTTRADIFASAANYLSENNWNGTQVWGRQVSLLPQFKRGYINSDAKFTLQDWGRLGVRTVNGTALPNEAMGRVALISPDGAAGKTYLVYNNFQTIMSWNRSKYFALSVGMLGDEIAKARPQAKAAASAKNQ